MNSTTLGIIIGVGCILIGLAIGIYYHYAEEWLLKTDKFKEVKDGPG